MSRLLLLALLALAPAARGADALVHPEFRTLIPNGLASTAVQLAGTSEAHLALMVPVGASHQSSSLPGLARAVALHRANPPGAEGVVEVETGAEWTVFRIAGPAEEIDLLAKRLASVVEAAGEAGGLPAAGRAEACRDAFYAAAYPHHPLGHALTAQSDPGDLVVRGLARFYTPAGSQLLVVSGRGIFETAVEAAAPFKGWPVSSTKRPVEQTRPIPGGGETTVAVPADEPPMLLVGGRVPGGVDDPTVRLVALRVLADRAAARWSAESLPGPAPDVRSWDGGLWAFDLHVAESPSDLDAAADVLRGVLDELAGGPIEDAEILDAAGRLEAARRSSAEIGPADYLDMLIDARRRGSSSGVALEAAALGRVDVDAVRRGVAGLAAAPILTVRGVPR